MKTNTRNFFVVLSLALALGLVAPTNTFATDNTHAEVIEVPLTDEGANFQGYANTSGIAMIDTADDTVNPETTETYGMGAENQAYYQKQEVLSGIKETATAAEFEALLESVDKDIPHSLAWLAMSTSIDVAEMVSTDNQLYQQVTELRANIIKAATVDTSSWNTLPFYELVNVAKASPDYNTNSALQTAVKAAEEILNTARQAIIDSYAEIKATGAQTVDDLKKEYATKTLSELLTLVKSDPLYARYQALKAAYLNALVFATELESGSNVITVAEITAAYNDLYRAAIAFYPDFVPNVPAPQALPETSVNTTPETPNTKAPNTGIFSHLTAGGAAVTTTIMAVTAGLAILLAARHQFRRQTRKIRKF